MNLKIISLNNSGIFQPLHIGQSFESGNGWVGGKSHINQQNFCMVCLASNDYKSSTKNTYSLSALSQRMNHEIHALI